VTAEERVTGETARDEPLFDVESLTPSWYLDVDELRILAKKLSAREERFVEYWFGARQMWKASGRATPITATYGKHVFDDGALRLGPLTRADADDYRQFLIAKGAPAGVLKVKRVAAEIARGDQ
jgi:hypothetical protein